MKNSLIPQWFFLPLTIIAAGLFVAGPARAQLIYDNGPATGTINAWNIGPDWSTSDSFTVSSSTILQSAQAGLWVESDMTVTNVQWFIGTTPFASDISSGNAHVINTLLGPARNNQFSLYESDFAITGSVTPGTYYLTLRNASGPFPDSGGPVGWDESDGPSSYFEDHGGAPQTIHGSESFQLFSVPVPEPATITLFAVLAAPGMLWLGLRKKAPVAR